MKINNIDLIGKEILIKRGLIKEVITVTKVDKIVEGVYSIHGHNSRRKMVATMTDEEIDLRLVRGDK